MIDIIIRLVKISRGSELRTWNVRERPQIQRVESEEQLKNDAEAKQECHPYQDIGLGEPSRPQGGN